MLARDAVLDRVAQLGERLQTERFGELVVDRHRAGRLDRLGGDDEFGVLAGEIGFLIVRRERHLQRARLAGRDADHLVLEAGNEGIRADQHDGILARTAFERLAVDGAGKGDDDAIVLGSLLAFALRAIGLVLLADARERLVHLGLGHLAGQPGQLDGLEIGERDRRHDLDRHGVVEVALARDQFLDRVLLGRQRHLRIGGELEAALADDLVVGVAHRRLDHLGHGRAPVDAPEVGDRHLAGTEAVDADAVLQLVQARGDLGVELGGRNDHLEFALETFGQRFGNLHRSHTSLRGRARRRTCRNDGRSCARPT